ncbi:hypothetical protein BH10CYA1_BH10CYA1_58490 [soil metagenome]
MYKVEKTEDEVIVSGPQGYEKRLPNKSIGMVLRPSTEEPWQDVLKPYTLQISKMTDEELVACALEIEAYV